MFTHMRNKQTHTSFKRLIVQVRLQSTLLKGNRLPGCTIYRVNGGRNITGIVFTSIPPSQPGQKHGTLYSILIITLSLHNERVYFWLLWEFLWWGILNHKNGLLLFCASETEKLKEEHQWWTQTSVHKWIELLQTAIYLLWEKKNIHLSSLFCISKIQK